MWRPVAKITGYVEVVRLGLVFVGFVSLLVVAIVPAMVTTLSGKNPHPMLALVLLFVILAVALVSLAFEVYTTWRLFAACKPDCEITIALKQCCHWRNVKMVFLCFYPFSFYLVLKMGLFWVIFQTVIIVWHVLAMLVVQKFINELKVTRDAQLDVNSVVSVEAAA